MNFKDELKDIAGVTNPDGFPDLPEWYIKPTIKLSKNDGNAFRILYTAKQAIKQQGVYENRVDDYEAELEIYNNWAISDDYNRLLRATMYWCDVV